MMFVIGTLFFALAVFPNSIESSSPPKSPIRMPYMTHIPAEGPSTSGRSSRRESENRVEFGSESHLISLMDDLLNADTGDSVGFNIEVNPAGLFYEENGMFIPVHRNIPLVKTMGFTIGRAHNGIVLPIYNNRRQRIMASSSNDYVQAVINDEDARNLGIGGPVPAGSVQPSSITNTENRRRGNRRRH